MSEEPSTIDRYQKTFGLSSTEAEELIVKSFKDEHATLLGQIANSSNTTLLIDTGVINQNSNGEAGSKNYKVVYKPIEAEQPLHDFPENLARREVASYVISSFLGWDIIPPTVMVDGPLGAGSAQLFVEADFAEHYLSLIKVIEDKNSEDPETLSWIGSLDDTLKQTCAFDYIANNTDRKSSHCILDEQSRLVWGIDQGLCLHEIYKLRTVIWDFADQPLPATITKSLTILLDNWDDFEDNLTRYELEGSRLLDSFELDALKTRTRALLSSSRFPVDETGGRRYPWPIV